MTDELYSAEDVKSPPGERIRFRLRHLFYLLTAACLVLGVPMLGATFGSLITAILIAAAILGPLMVVQAFMVLLIPGLRRRLFPMSPPEKPNAESRGRRE